MTRYPIYIISKGRAESRLTVRALQGMGIDFRLVVEPQELDEYKKHDLRWHILLLPESEAGSGCSIPARNFCWEHAVRGGHKRHWILDDNILMFMRLNRNEKIRIAKGDGIFRAAEDFVDRYENIALAGFNYRHLCKAVQSLPPFYLNTRIYSCILIDNSLPFRWRGRYNEDTDLSLRALKAGHCTVLFNAFLAEKTTTMKLKGGNTDLLYIDEGRKLMAESLAEQHPDVARVSFKFHRYQHHVDYSGFKQKLAMKEGIVLPEKNNEYGMTNFLVAQNFALL